MAEWMGATGEVSYKLNTDYNLTQISPQLMKEIITGNTLGKIPLIVLFQALKDGELMHETIKTFEDFKTALEEEAPIVSNSALPPKANNDIDLQQLKDDVGATN